MGQDGYLHIVARRIQEGRWTSARLVTHELQSFQYGRRAARFGILENIGKEPTLVHGILHGPGCQGVGLGKLIQLPSGKPFGDDFHAYGIL